MLAYPNNKPAIAGPTTAAINQHMLFIEIAFTNESIGTNCGTNALKAEELNALTIPVPNTIA